MIKSLGLYQFSREIQLEYAVYGAGPKSLICFHGFGQDYSVFEKLSEQVSDYQIISVNLLFHGQSNRVNQRKYLTHEEWHLIFSGFLQKLAIKKFSMVAYSLGGRYAISTMYGFADQIEHCILVAPDSIVKRFWYEVSTTPFGPEQLFRLFMKYPGPFFLFLTILEKLRLMNVWTIRFSRSQLIEPWQRQMVLQSWITLKKLRLSQQALAAHINSASFKTDFIFGSYDSIIQPKHHLPFLNKLQNSKVINLEAGHAKLLNEAFKTIAQLLP